MAKKPFLTDRAVSRCARGRSSDDAAGARLVPGEIPLVGGCLCGGVRYAIAGSLRHASHCHCAMCRKHQGVALGTLDGDPGVRPSLHIFVGSRAPWYEFADDLPKHPTSPRAEAIEPA